MNKYEIISEVKAELQADHLRKFKDEAKNIISTIHSNNARIAKLLDDNVRLKRDLANLNFVQLEEII